MEDERSANPVCVSSLMMFRSDECAHLGAHEGHQQNFEFVTELVTVMVTMSVMIVIIVAVVMVMVVLPGMLVTISVAASMFWSPPIAFSIVPALGTMFVARDHPACALIRRAAVVAWHPAIMVALGRPESGHPYKRGLRRRRWRLDTNRRRSNTDVDRNLRPGRRGGHCCNKSERQNLFEHGFPSSIRERMVAL